MSHVIDFNLQYVIIQTKIRVNYYKNISQRKHSNCRTILYSSEICQFDMIRIVIFFILSSSTIILCHYFKTLISACALEGNIFITTTMPSDIACAYLCDSFSHTSCTRFVWNVNSRLCYLHSDELSGTTVQFPANSKWIGKRSSTSGT